MLRSTKLYLNTIGILAVLLICMFVWKNIAVRDVEKTVEAQCAKLVEKSQQVITNKTHELLRLATIPLVWVVRKEMINEN